MSLTTLRNGARCSVKSGVPQAQPEESRGS